MASELPRLRALRTRDDIQVLGWPAPMRELLATLDRQLDVLDADPLRAEPIRNYLLVVKDSSGDYNGLLPASGRIEFNLRQTYVIAWFNEDNEDIALIKIKTAYDLGPDTNPTL